MNARFVIGFTTLEEFLKHSSGTEIYLSGNTKTQTGQYGIKLRNWYVTVAEIRNEHCYYWQQQTGASQSVGGNPMGDQEEASRKRTFALLNLLKEEIGEKRPQAKVIDAIVSFPSDSEPLSGSTELFIYDKETDLYQKTKVNFEII